MKIDLGMEIQSLPKYPFLTVFSKMYRPTKVDVQGICFCFLPWYPKLTLYAPKMASKLTLSYLSRCFTNVPAIQLQLFRASLKQAQCNLTKHVVCKSTARWHPKLWNNFKLSETSLSCTQGKHVLSFCSSFDIQDPPQHPPGPP